MSSEKSMQVSKATVRAVTTRCVTLIESVEVLTTTYIYHYQ